MVSRKFFIDKQLRNRGDWIRTSGLLLPTQALYPS